MTDGIYGPDPTTGRLASHLLTEFCHPFDRVFDSGIGGVQKVTGGTDDVNPITTVDLPFGGLGWPSSVDQMRP